MTTPARRPGLLVRELPGETLVYDVERHRAHCLNRSAGEVFRLCDGRRSPREIAAVLDGGDDEEREAAVGVALRALGEAELLLGDGAAVPPDRAASGEPATDELSRRVLLGRVGASLLLPAIASVLAPTPAQAASACINQLDCTVGNVGTPCWCNDPSECSANTCQAGALPPHCAPCG